MYSAFRNGGTPDKKRMILELEWVIIPGKEIFLVISCTDGQGELWVCLLRRLIFLLQL